ncbi:hypothetical protein INR49_027978 [Caranx melampygus]|nr:hypothetical protein INR49_027978 [Caranx melampygus]
MVSLSTSGIQFWSNLTTAKFILVWKDDFRPVLTWQPPKPPSGCEYRVQSETQEQDDDTRELTDSPWTSFLVMQGGFLRLTVTTVCNNSESEAVVLNRSYPEIVKNLECYAIPSKRSQCSWETVHAGVRFFYQLVRDDFSNSLSNQSSSPLRECPLYINEGIRTVCDLEATVDHGIHILFNGTENDKLVKNTFTKLLSKKVRLPPLNWTVTKVGNKFNINWIPPDIKAQWEYLINYTECNKSKDEIIVQGYVSYELVLVPHCNYFIQIQARNKDWSTPWSNIIFFAADRSDRDPNAVVWAAIIIPLVFAGLAILIFVCCRKNKDHIFPKVPQPRDFLSDIYDNNNKSTIRDLYIPAEEEENCKIILVIDSQNEYKPDC